MASDIRLKKVEAHLSKVELLKSIVPRTRLQKRIYRLLVGLVVSLTILGSIAVWLIIAVMEDATLDRFIMRTIDQVIFYRDHPLVSQQSLFIANSKDELIGEHGAAAWPQTPGLHTFFADDAGRNVLFGDSWSDRWDRWVANPREREYRLWYEPANATSPELWIILDLEFSEFTEKESGTITQFFFAYLTAIVIGAFISGYIIIRWAISPIQTLTMRVRNRTKSTTEVSSHTDPYKEDEIKFLECVIDDYAHSLERSLEREKAFISDCSHELRTPITILNSALTLEKELKPSDTERRKSVMQRVARSGLRMERLVNAFLILARSQAHRPNVTEEWILRQLVDEVIEEIQVLHPTKEIQLCIEIPATYQCQHQRESLFCICHNLINNSFSHLEEGSLTIRLLSIEGESFDLDFIDKGISPDSPSKTGAGIGLSLVQRLCDKEGWKLKKINTTQGTHYRLRIV